MKHRIGDCRSDAGERDFAQAFAPVLLGINFARFAQGCPDPPHRHAPDSAHRGARNYHPSAIIDADDARTGCAASRTSTKCAM